MLSEVYLTPSETSIEAQYSDGPTRVWPYPLPDSATDAQAEELRTWLESNTPEVYQIPAHDQALANLNASDQGMVRVIEDLIYALAGAEVIALTDLPQAAQDKLAAREEYRDNL